MPATAASKGVTTLSVSSQTGSGYIVIDAGKCKGCNLCVHACPKGVIGPAAGLNQMGYTPAEVIPDKADDCTGCTVCAIMCPDTAIAVYRHDRVLSHATL